MTPLPYSNAKTLSLLFVSLFMGRCCQRAGDSPGWHQEGHLASKT